MAETIFAEDLEAPQEDKNFLSCYKGFSTLYLQDKPRQLPETALLRQEVINFGEEFFEGFKTIRTIFKEGGTLEEVKFQPCQLKAHDWNHIEQDVTILLKILPGFLRENPGKYNFAQVKAALWGMLFHDIGYLLQEGEQGYAWAGELWFEHVDRGMTLVDKLIEGLGIKLSESERKLAKAAIKITDFNDDPQAIREQINKGLPGTVDLLELTWSADLLSYFTDQADIPWGVQNLFWENQARVKPSEALEGFLTRVDPQTQEKMITKIAKTRGVNEEDLRQDIKNGRLTIADLKFPGQNIHQFLAGRFPKDMYSVMERFLDYTNVWFGTKPNQLKENYRQTIARAEVLQSIDEMTGKKDPYCFFEGAFTGLDLQHWVVRLEKKGTKFVPEKEFSEVLKLGGRPESDYWTEVDKRVLGVAAVEHPFQRLVTREIKGILEAVPEGKRQEALADLLLLFLEKNKGAGGCEEYEMRLSPGAYERILTHDQIFGAFQQANQEFAAEYPLAQNSRRELHFVWTIRRDRPDPRNPGQNELNDDLVQKLLAYKDQGKLFHVDFAGRETDKEDTKIATYAPFLKTLIEKDLLVSLQAGQILVEDVGNEEVAKNITSQNLKAALGLIEAIDKKRKNILLVGLQRLADCPELIERVKIAGVPFVVSNSYDVAIFGPGFFGANRNHPVQLLYDPEGQRKILFGTANNAFLSSAITVEVLKALLLINPQADKEWLEQQARKIFGK